jgi:glutaconate CoA-transferase subunit A
MRNGDPELPDEKLVVMDNPFGDWSGTDKVVLVPAITPDVTLIHVQAADRAGTLRMQGLPFTDVEQAKAARCVIVTCETLVEDGALRENPGANQIPFFCVDAVVPVPMGAYPTACYHYYDYDPVFLKRYRHWAEDDGRYEEYLRRSIYETRDHAAFLGQQAPEALEKIRADRRTGYAVGLDRR